MIKTGLFFACILILGILPHMQIFPLDVTVSGRWFYIASLGLLGTLGVLLNKTTEKLLIIPIVCFFLITFNRTYDFRNGFALYSNDIRYDKNNFNLENNLGVEYYRLGKYDKAGMHFQRSVDLNPRWWTSYNNLGVYQEGLGNYDRALGLYKKAIDNGQYYLAYENYARLLIRQEKYEEAKEFIVNTLKYFPENITLQEFQKMLISQ